MSEHLASTRRYLAAIESGATGESLAAFFDPEVIQEEFPNRLVPKGARRDLAAILEAAERGQRVIRDQRYEVLSSTVEGDRVALEVSWRGTLRVPVGTLAEGDEMRARFAVFLRFRGGRIVEQRNYDCFEPF